jgi:hypothetical protein
MNIAHGSLNSSERSSLVPPLHELWESADQSHIQLGMSRWGYDRHAETYKFDT